MHYVSDVNKRGTNNLLAVKPEILAKPSGLETFFTAFLGFSNKLPGFLDIYLTAFLAFSSDCFHCVASQQLFRKLAVCFRSGKDIHANDLVIDKNQAAVMKVGYLEQFQPVFNFVFA